MKSTFLLLFNLCVTLKKLKFYLIFIERQKKIGKKKRKKYRKVIVIKYI